MEDRTKIVFFAIFIIVCGMKYQCVKKKNIWWKNFKKYQKKRKRVSLNMSPILNWNHKSLKKIHKNDLNFLSLMWLHFTELTSKVFILSVHGGIWCLQPC